MTTHVKEARVSEASRRDSRRRSAPEISEALVALDDERAAVQAELGQLNVEFTAIKVKLCSTLSKGEYEATIARKGEYITRQKALEAQSSDLRRRREALINETGGDNQVGILTAILRELVAIRKMMELMPRR